MCVGEGQNKRGDANGVQVQDGAGRWSGGRENMEMPVVCRWQDGGWSRINMEMPAVCRWLLFELKSLCSDTVKPERCHFPT